MQHSAVQSPPVRPLPRSRPYPQQMRRLCRGAVGVAAPGIVGLCHQASSGLGRAGGEAQNHAIKVVIEAFKVWRALDRAYTAVKDAEEAAKIADGVLDSERALAEAEKAESAGTEAPAAPYTASSRLPRSAWQPGSAKPISQIKPGDTVLATDLQTGITAPETVQNVIVDTAPVRGSPLTGKHYPQTLTTTWHHPFWDAGHHRWVDAHNLTPGTKPRRADGTTVAVTGVRNFHAHKTTYDLTVGTLHTYYVLFGEVPILVHNALIPVLVSMSQRSPVFTPSISTMGRNMSAVASTA
jgi:Pretoxin HINT domain